MRNPLIRRSIRIGIICLLPGLLLMLEMLPHPLQANEQTRWFAATGHTVDDTYGFLSYWRDHDGAYLLGLPVTEVLDEDGITVQYFERARLEYHPKLEGGTILRGRIGADYARALWRTFQPAPVGPIDEEHERLFTATDYTLSEPFLSFWEAYDGLAAFGYPISAPLWEYIGHQVLLVQYFERGRLEYDPSAGTTLDAVHISNLGRDLALLHGYDTATVATTNEPVLLMNTPTPLPTLVPTAVPPPPPIAPAAPPAPAPQPVAPAPQPMVVAPATAPAPASGGGRKSIVVNISQQWLYAYEGSTIVFDAPVTTGKDGFNTPPGNFAIYAKVPSQTMSGNLGGESYRVPNVPHAMYIYGDVAMHGTYWHNAFGSGVRLSHGCINLPLWAASWVYNWAPVGTPVQVRY